MRGGRGYDVLSRVASALLSLALLVGCSRAAPAAAHVGSTPRSGTSALEVAAPPTVFAVIGDFGTGNENEAAVSKLVASWRPSFIVAVGDNYLTEAGGEGTARYDDSVGRFYCAWLKDVSTTGSECRVGKAARNAFFPCLGNHDYSDASPEDYVRYFDLPGAGFTNTSGNERYYDYVDGPIHFFVLNSNDAEPDGTSSDSKQAAWLKARLGESASRWDIVYDHHPPFSSDHDHGSTEYMQWPFAAWGADAVMSGHAHDYERVMHDGIPYFVNGLGGAGRYDFADTVDGSAVRYNADWGAQKVTVTDTSATFEFYSVSGERVDSFELTKK